MRKSICVLSAALALSFAGVPAAQAFTISIVPQSPTVTPGSTFSIDVVASDLAGGASPSLGTYDLDFKYDASVLSFTSAAIGTGLSLAGVESFTDVVASGPGTVNLFELSLNSIAELNTLQDGAFKLFTLTFSADSAGTSALDVMVNVLGAADGNPLTASVNGASVSVAPVPLPGAAFLLLSGLATSVSFLRGSGRARRARTAAATPGAQ